MSTTLVTFSLLLLLRIAGGGEIPARPVTVIGLTVSVPRLRDDPHQVAWTNDLTLGQLIMMHRGLSYPGSPDKAEVRRLLADGTESKATYNLRRDFKPWKDGWIDPKLQPGDWIIFSYNASINLF
jgi:hypothetical protein